MKKLILIAFLLLGIGTIKAQEQELNVSEPISSGCLSRSSEDGVSTSPTIVLKKEGSALFVELLNYDGNCGTTDFKLDNSVSVAGDGESSVKVVINPVVPIAMDCTCPFNISFAIYDLNTTSFFLRCWWFEGMVELTEGEPLVLEYKTEDVIIDGLKYRLLKITHQAMLLYQTTWNSKSQTLQIPSEIEYEGEKYTVTSINELVFDINTTITEVTIPKTIKNTGFGKEDGVTINPFGGCLSMESIDVEEDNPILCSVDGILFNKDKTILVGYPAGSFRESYTVPDGVKATAAGAFCYSQHLKKVVLPENMETLSFNLFGNSKMLEEVILPSNTKELPSEFFYECKKLKSVVIPEGTTIINGGCFMGCSSLESISLPASVDTVGINVFYDCTSLKSITLSPNLKQISKNMFKGCSKLSEVAIPTGVTTIGDGAFAGCKAMQTLDLPESVNRIEGFAFGDCKFKTLYIQGIIPDDRIDKFAFARMNSQTILFVQPSEVDKYKVLYDGPVYPLSSSDQILGISDAIRSATISSDSFDLQGRPVKDTSKHGVYIKDGRKVIR